MVYFSNGFENATVFDQDLSTWDTSSALSMTEMFKNAINFNQNISAWDTSSVMYFSGMFDNATAFQFGAKLGPLFDVDQGFHVSECYKF